MIELIENVVIGEIQRVNKRVADTPGSYGAYVDLSTMESGDSVIFWLEYDIGGTNAPLSAGSILEITYDDIAQIYDEGGPNEETILNAAWALEPVTLEVNQVSQIAFAQTAGVPKDFATRNTKMEDGT